MTHTLTHSADEGYGLWRSSLKAMPSSKCFTLACSSSWVSSFTTTASDPPEGGYIEDTISKSCDTKPFSKPDVCVVWVGRLLTEYLCVLLALRTQGMYELNLWDFAEHLRISICEEQSPDFPASFIPSLARGKTSVLLALLCTRHYSEVKIPNAHNMQKITPGRRISKAGFVTIQQLCPSLCLWTLPHSEVSAT